MDKKIIQLKEIIRSSNNIVFFGGAGVSTESGMPDFRGKDGLYNQKYKFLPEEVLSHTFFVNHTDEFFIFYKEKMNALSYEPNITHKKLVELEKREKLKAIITQNIDGLHSKAGSKKIFELHGSIYRNYCRNCHNFYEGKKVFESKGVPKCSCGGIIKPDVVLYEEALDEKTLNQAIEVVEKAEVLIVAGTSLTVYPASGLIRFFKGKYLVLINKDKTPYDCIANLVIHDSLGNVFQYL